MVGGNVRVCGIAGATRYDRRVAPLGLGRRTAFITYMISINSYRSDVRLRQSSNQRGGFVLL